MSSKAVWLAGIVSAVFVLLGVRAFLDPVAASASFGLPMHTDAETTFVRVYGARNALLGAVALTFVVLGMMRPLVLLFSLATVLPVLDATVVASRVGLGHELTRHVVILVVLAAISVSLWRRRDARAQRDVVHLAASSR